MSSTRNKNTFGNYALEKRMFTENINYNLLNTQNENPQLAGNGMIQGPMSKDYFSTNSVDIESFLKGIHTTDLTQHTHTNLTPQLTHIKTMDLYCNQTVHMPSNFQLLDNQRPHLK
jgi:hypothetical protein